ncbi:MAG: hypothetical protein EP330_18510 [Deltaproteobacteria bacterium]|nr:MAG: hypothetical protein EP330_18510 [Deltaproteobacteria bacterium]
MKNPHIALSLGRDLWEDLLRTALPVEIAHGEFDMASGARGALRQIGLRERVAGLLEDTSTPAPVRSVGTRARNLWRRGRPVVKRQLKDLVQVEGTYKVELSESGTEFGYGRQRIQADAYVRGVAEGTIYLARNNVELPFRIERQIGAAVVLGDIHYDRHKKAVIGSLGDLALHLGDHAVFQLVARLGEKALEQQLPRVNPVPILRRDQVEEMVGGLGGALNTKMGVDELELVITEDELSLQVRFGFTQAQLEDSERE